ncbi:hypothetical protein [Levilactobacillus angrenensis]|uniref:Uncharacterized protein n=1 Tax=Levilactobacillus angrenensis TaxID=2486020 RepID=A0ABW1U8C2_9LACO|nr:hypothetical protein [Levilactobacillus angrenensis]
MSKHHQAYQSPFAKMLTDQRYPFASQLAIQAGLDPSQVMFAYLKISASVPNTLGETARQKEIDRRFQAFLTDAQQ